jgi:hypothetical protein
MGVTGLFEFLKSARTRSLTHRLTEGHTEKNTLPVEESLKRVCVEFSLVRSRGPAAPPHTQTI